MRLLFVTWWPPGHYGHTWHATEDIERDLHARGITFSRLSGETLQPPVTLTRILGRARFILALITRARRSDAVLAYMDSPTTRVIAVLKRLGLMSRTKLVITDFWLNPPREPRRTRDVIKALFLRHVYGCADMVLFDTRPGLELYRKARLLGGKPLMFYLQCTEMRGKLDMLSSLPAAPSAFAPPFPGPYFFATGATSRDFATVLRAAEELPDVSFAIMAKRVLGSRLPPNVKELPWGSFDEYLQILRGAKAVIIPTLPGVEAAGIRTLHEAWGLSVPVIIGSNDGIDPYLDHPEAVAFSYEAGDLEGLEAAILAVEGDPSKARSVADAARSALETRWTSAAYVEDLIAYLNRLLPRTAGGQRARGLGMAR